MPKVIFFEKFGRIRILRNRTNVPNCSNSSSRSFDTLSGQLTGGYNFWWNVVWYGTKQTFRMLQVFDHGAPHVPRKKSVVQFLRRFLHSLSHAFFVEFSIIVMDLLTSKDRVKLRWLVGQWQRVQQDNQSKIQTIPNISDKYSPTY